MREYHFQYREILETEIRAAQVETDRQQSTQEAIAAGYALGYLSADIDLDDIDADSDPWRYFT